MMRSMIALAVLAGMGTPAVAAEQKTPIHGAGHCNARAVQDLVGRKQSPMLERVAKRRAHARVIRWIPIGTMVTMDYRSDRLNLRLGPNRRITQVTCG